MLQNDGENVDDRNTRHSIDNRIIGTSRIVQDMRQVIRQAGSTGKAVLICGEVGSGRALTAQVIHRKKHSAQAPFLSLNCSLYSEQEARLRLFGSQDEVNESHHALIKKAIGGSLFLEDIDLLEETLQKQLSSSNEIQKGEVTLICSISQDREDTCSRQSVPTALKTIIQNRIVIVPPLRQRGADRYLLADYFTDKYTAVHNRHIRRLSSTALEMIGAYAWPGNIRELENVIERAVLMASSDTIQGHDLPPSLQLPGRNSRVYKGDLQTQLDQLEYELIVDALRMHHGNMSKAADHLGLSKRIMGLRMKKYDLDYRHFRKGHERYIPAHNPFTGSRWKPA